MPPILHSNKNNNRKFILLYKMEVYFGEQTNQNTSSCLIKVAGINILCNSSLSLSHLSNFWPQHCTIPLEYKEKQIITLEKQEYKREKIKFELHEISIVSITDIDVILISNIQDLLSYTCLYSKGFKGKVFATNPILLFGKKIAYDLADLIRKANYDINNGELNGNHEKSEEYTSQKIDSAFSNITSVSFKEIVQVSEAVKLRGISSGYELGSCNWNIWAGDTLITYMSLSSVVPYRYPQEFDLEGVVKSNVLIIRQNCATIGAAPKNYDLQLQTILGNCYNVWERVIILRLLFLLAFCSSLIFWMCLLTNLQIKHILPSFQKLVMHL